ncbi:MAG: ABC transporter permease subunit, partial [Nocardioidaceae bacterium]
MRLIDDAWAYLSDGAHWTGGGGMGQLMIQQLLLTFTAMVLACLIGLPIAIILGHLGRGGFLAINISNVGRAVPTFAVLVLLSVGPAGTAVLGPYGRAGLATLIALVLFALPPIITNAYVGMREVDRDTVEAARGMG